MTLPLILEPDALEAELGTSALQIVCVVSAEAFAAGHIPGARHVSPQALQRGGKPAPGKLPDVPALQALLAKAGVTPDTHVIACDDEGGGWAGRLIWTLDAVGHHNYSFLNGGLNAWIGEGRPVEAGPDSNPPAEPLEITVNPAVIAEIDDILPRLDDPGIAIWDARSPEEYRGEKVVAARGGHIPGAFNIDWLELMDRQRHLRLIDLDALKQRLANIGVTPDKEVITHCQTHHRSGLSYLAMKAMGFNNIRGYHGSWSEWGNDPALPVVTGDQATS